MKYQAYYPKLFLPFNYSKILESQPAVPKEPTKPSMPVAPKEPTASGEPRGCMAAWLILVLFIFGVMMLISSADEKKDKGTAVLVGFGFILAAGIGFYSDVTAGNNHKTRIVKQKTEYERDRANFWKIKQQYEKDLENYRINKQNYDEKVKNSTSSTELFNYRYGQIEDILHNLPERWSTNSNNSFAFYKNHSVFVNHLLKYFDVKCSYDSATLLYEKDKSLFSVDIKIDIPYDLVSGDVLSSSANDYIYSNTNKGRVLIVFAEEQTILNPTECIYFIQRTISALTSLKPIESLIFSPDKIKSWSREAATKMAFKRFRNTYLNKSDLSEYKAQRYYFNNYKDKDTDLAVDDLPF